MSLSLCCGVCLGRVLELVVMVMVMVMLVVLELKGWREMDEGVVDRARCERA